MTSRIMPGSVNSAVENDNNIALIDLDKVAATLGKTAKVDEKEPQEEKRKGFVPFEKKKKSVEEKMDKKSGHGCRCADGCKCEGECKCADGCKCGMPSKKASSPKGFAIPSAKYIREAEARGDWKAKEEALKVRSAFRKNYLSKLAAVVDAEEDRQEVIASRQNERQEIIASVTKREVEERKQKRNAILAKSIKNTKTVPARKEISDFVGAKDMNSLTKEIVRKRLVKAGLDPQMANLYTKYALNTSNEEKVPEFVDKLAKTKMPKVNKTALFNSWIKEAKLDEADRSRLRDYWANELGYQDKEWVDDLVTNYDKDGN